MHAEVRKVRQAVRGVRGEDQGRRDGGGALHGARGEATERRERRERANEDGDDARRLTREDDGARRGNILTCTSAWMNARRTK